MVLIRATVPLPRGTWEVVSAAHHRLPVTSQLFRLQEPERGSSKTWFLIPLYIYAYYIYTYIHTYIYIYVCQYLGVLSL